MASREDPGKWPCSSASCGSAAYVSCNPARWLERPVLLDASARATASLEEDRRRIEGQIGSGSYVVGHKKNERRGQVAPQAERLKCRIRLEQSSRASERSVAVGRSARPSRVASQSSGGAGGRRGARVGGWRTCGIGEVS